MIKNFATGYEYGSKGPILWTRSPNSQTIVLSALMKKETVTQILWHYYTVYFCPKIKTSNQHVRHLLPLALGQNKVMSKKKGQTFRCPFGNETKTFWYCSQMCLVENSGTTSDVLVSFLLDVGTFLERLLLYCFDITEKNPRSSNFWRRHTVHAMRVQCCVVCLISTFLYTIHLQFPFDD